MIDLNIDSYGGQIRLFGLNISWSNFEPSQTIEGFAFGDLPGFTAFSWGDSCLEFGQVDQERPGIYFTKYEDGDVKYSRPLLQF
jgi:hypothetical protein